MAVSWMDGWEIDFPNNNPGLWDSVYNDAGSLSHVNTWSRTGNGSVLLSINQGTGGGAILLQKNLDSPLTEMYIGFVTRRTGSLSSNAGIGPNFFHTASSGGSYQISLSISPGGYIRVARGGYNGTILGTGATTVISPDTDYYIELHIIIDDVAGEVELKIDGSTELNLVGIDTNNADGNVQKIWLGPAADSGEFDSNIGTWYYDDFAICDTTGVVANSWLDGAGCELLIPVADGFHGDWTSTGVNDYTEIDEWGTYGVLGDGDTTTVSTNVTDERVSVELSPTTIPGDVRGIMLIGEIRNDGAGLDQVEHFVRLSGVDYDTTPFVPPNTYIIRKDILTVNPATGVAWTPAEIDLMEYGMHRVT